ncbi:MAG: DNA replication and repair protein RecF [Salinivirgaceae bacterium]|jgi:DNA replication and repair protein RecF|nr:DNA replication and repair protein RecF [Salinivirgaceae bacterium]
MYLQSLSLLNFKNYTQIDVDFSSKINCFTGNNGVGKTNILDSIYYLSFCKSFFSSIDSMNINHSQNFFVINGEYQLHDKPEQIYCGFEQGKKKKFKRNKKEYDKLADHIGLIPLVMISPYDINLILGGSEERRKFIDGIISQFDRNYLYDLQNYNRALTQRNHLLKLYGKTGYFDVDVVDLYDNQLAEFGNRIFEKRKEFIDNIGPVFQKFFSHISQGKEEVQLNYESQLQQESFDILLANSREKDKMARYTTVGIHKDGLDLLLGDYPLRKLGSQGQQKSYLVALKLAQFEYIQMLCGFKPILLLDDIFDKLDSERVEQIIKLVAQNNFGQIFITDTNPARLNKVLEQIEGEYFHYLVKDEMLTKLN